MGGGGEGNGKLSSMVNSLYAECKRRGISTVILVICGRNQLLKNSLESRDWDLVWREQEKQYQENLVQVESSKNGFIRRYTSGEVMNHLNPLRLFGKKRRNDAAAAATTTTATSSTGNDDNNDSDDVGCGSCID